MVKKNYRFNGAAVDYYLPGSMGGLKNMVPKGTTVIITDENVFEHHQQRFKGWNTIVLKSGEQYKTQLTVDSVVEQLIALGADRTWTLVGIGGGVITDLTGYIASIYMRGLAFGFVPTTLLAMVDASIGGKNGVDVGIYKNMVGTIRQPAFILWDITFLKTLPEDEWRNGFAEIIKHACIRDRGMFAELEKREPSFFYKKKGETMALIQRNVLIKTGVVQKDQFESGDRKLLNFGHTLGHALENQYELSHGQAISIGMTFAARLSAELTGFKQVDKVINLLEKYGLPTDVIYNKKKVFNALQKDKKKGAGAINFILLNKIGKGLIQSIPVQKLKDLL